MAENGSDLMLKSLQHVCIGYFAIIVHIIYGYD